MCQYDYRWNSIELCWDDEDVDFYVILKRPSEGDAFVPSRTIVFAADSLHGEPMEGEPIEGEPLTRWLQAKPSEFWHVHSRDRYLNSV